MAAKPGILSRAADAVLPRKVIRLIADDGALFHSFEIPASRDWPAAVICGIASGERVFVHDKKSGEYRQVTFCHAPLPELGIPFAGFHRRMR